MIKHLCILLLIGSVMMLPGCGGEDNPAAGADDGTITIAMLPKARGIPYFSSCADGAREAAEELGNVRFIYDGPSDGSPERAAEMIDRWSLQGVDVIAVSPNDPDVVAPAMRRAQERGTRVITFDADGAEDARSLFVNQATAQEIGYALVDRMVEDLGSDRGQVAIITATLTAANQNEWIKHMRTRLEERYPDLELIGVQPSNEDQRTARNVARDLMASHPDLKGIFAISSIAFPGAAEAVREADRSGEVLVIGLSTPNDMRSYVEDGTVQSVILWDTVNLGYLTVYTAEALATGKIDPDSADHVDAGRLGERPIINDHVLLGDILVFTEDNIGEYDF